MIVTMGQSFIRQAGAAAVATGMSASQVRQFALARQLLSAIGSGHAAIASAGTGGRLAGHLPTTRGVVMGRVDAVRGMQAASHGMQSASRMQPASFLREAGPLTQRVGDAITPSQRLALHLVSSGVKLT